MKRQPSNAENKEQFWQQTMREAARSGTSIRAFCRQHGLSEKRFYYWQRKLKQRRQKRSSRKQAEAGKQTCFALVSDEPGSITAGIELVLNDGRRLRISHGVDEETLHAVLSALER